MSDFFDIYNLMILALAVGIFLRLRSVLGRRTGNERQSYDPYTAKSGQERGRDAARDNVVTLPRQPSAEAPAGSGAADVDARLTPVAKKGTPLYDQLLPLVTADPTFEPKRFLEGASMAYEMIVTAFATGDRAMLRPLLSPEVFDGFDAAITEREQAGQTMSTTLIGIEKIAISDASLRNDSARVTVRIESEMISATYNKAGELVDGDPNKVVDVVDVWTFERKVTEKDPNWALVATESA
ncbi:Tim44/TimA family putative adaptor protein [Acuticoccus kandeliae]|uniref:Tim44/TimA family putative adaptor protein n=1 Tax=Acuticoccus kandeliae TaxID=2073160 RepID=UPI000D3E3F96|nr:Tim44/TimA family putative adaptor protein [Acuticoccus kandeliae]